MVGGRRNLSRIDQVPGNIKRVVPTTLRLLLLSRIEEATFHRIIRTLLTEEGALIEEGIDSEESLLGMSNADRFTLMHRATRICTLAESVFHLNHLVLVLGLRNSILALVPFFSRMRSD